MRFDIEPGEGALPVRFGMHRDEVRSLLGPPEASNTIWNNSGTADHWLRSCVTIGYDNDAAVNHVGFSPGRYELRLGCSVLWSATEQPDPNPALLRADPAPLERLGFLVFRRLCVTTTGYHDGDRSQRALTAFPPGKWDDQLAEATTPDLGRYARTAQQGQVEPGPDLPAEQNREFTPLPDSLRAELVERASPRKLRLFACACCRSVWPLIDDPRSRDAVECAERFADGLADGAALKAAKDMAWAATQQSKKARPPLISRASARTAAWATAVLSPAKAAADARVDAALAAAWAVTEPDLDVSWEAFERGDLGDEEYESRKGVLESRRELESDRKDAEFDALLRDIVGNPHRPFALDPRWLTADVVDLARAIYEDRAFDRMPILADALMDAGCDNADIISHCRGEGPHVRGCWVVDLILGKQ